MIRELPPTAGLPLTLSDLISRPAETLEKKLARFIDVPEVLITCSGTAALIIALKTLQKRVHRKKVIIPAYTCPLVPLAIAHCGLITVVCDTAPDSTDFDLKHLQALCDEETLAIIPTHIAGIPADFEHAVSIARATGTYVIEDAAQSLGARRNGRSVGTSGDIGFFSLAAGKGLTLFEGGVLTARSKELYEACCETAKEAPWQIAMDIQRSVELLAYFFLYNRFGLHFTYGANLRSWLKRNDPVRAIGDYFSSEIPFHTVSCWRKKVGASAFERLPSWLLLTKNLAKERISQLEQIHKFKILKSAPDCAGTYPFFLILADTPGLKDLALDKLWQKGLGVSTLFVHDIHGYEYLKSCVQSGSTPHARAFASRVFSISNSPLVTEEDFQKILNILGSL